jgi:hypothetical protein
MNLTELQKKLMLAARLNAPSDAVPYAFEKRIMAHLAGTVKLRATETWNLWAGGLWRAAVPCSAIMLMLCAWSLLSSQEASSVPSGSTDLSQEMENTLLAAADQDPQPAGDKVW